MNRDRKQEEKKKDLELLNWLMYGIYFSALNIHMYINRFIQIYRIF